VDASGLRFSKPIAVQPPSLNVPLQYSPAP
jgi:hypothetical protein